MFPTRRTSWILLPYCLLSIMLTLEVGAESADQGRVLSQMIMVSDENDGPLMEQAKKYTDRNIPVILTKYGPIPYKPLPMSALDQPKDLSPMKKHPSGKGYYKSTITPVDIKTGEPLQPGRESLRSRYEPARPEHETNRLQRLEDSFDFNNFPSQRVQRTAAMQFNSPLHQRNDPFQHFNFYNSPYNGEADFGKNYFKRESGYRPSFPMDSRIVSDVRFGGSAAYGPEEDAAMKLALDPRTVEQARQMAERPFHDMGGPGGHFNMHPTRQRPSSISETHHHHDMKKDKRHHGSDSFPSSSESQQHNRNNRSHPPRHSSALHSVVRGSYGKTASNIPLY
ncbi:hypothetical protein LSTR_LSTR004562 [Laodelphax striatellus]|uniref:Uncharacterized protein n=1 Tax=Laodelphax striatellus TaxID=195883 RepID=A0A482WTN7_LAOST|nr:hypothetical protein LSTR_LSTR004562 [Laodelphax striatellus]